MAPSIFIRPIHPKTEIKGDAATFARVLGEGWVAQSKIHGHRAQVHVPSDPDEVILVYNRHGQLHRKELSPEIEAELARIFAPRAGWNVIDAEWIKPEGKLYVFDLLKREGTLLRSLPFQERWRQLPREFISPHLSILPVLRDVQACLKVMSADDAGCEGLVFRSPSPGFDDTSIVRCRKPQNRR